MPQLPIPIARVPELPAWCDPPSGRTSGYIVDSREWDLGLVEGKLVQIDLGRDDQVEPGDFLTVFRPSPRSRPAAHGPRRDRRADHRGAGPPRRWSCARDARGDARSAISVEMR